MRKQVQCPYSAYEENNTHIVDVQDMPMCKATVNDTGNDISGDEAFWNRFVVSVPSSIHQLQAKFGANKVLSKCL